MTASHKVAHAIGGTTMQDLYATCNRSFEVLNMTVDLVATDFARKITHDHYDQWHALSTI